jgi:hypothetical protein
MAAVLSRRHRKIEPLSGKPHTFGRMRTPFGDIGLGARRRNKSTCCLRYSVNALSDNRRKERLSNFGASFLIPLSGFREGQTILFCKFLDVLLLKEN